MNQLLRSAAIGALAASASAASAQSQFAARVFEDGTQRGVRSVIEYEASAGSWQVIKETDTSGTLSGQCPGSGRIRANPTPFHWEYRISRPATCGGAVPLPVEKRELAEIFDIPAADKDRVLTRREFGRHYLGVVLAQGGPAAASRDAGLLRVYHSDADRLSRAQRQRAETLILNQTSGSFAKIDADRNSELSEREIRAAIRRPY